MTDGPASLSDLGRRMLVTATIVITVVAVLLIASLRILGVARSRVIDTLDPASIEAERLRGAILDQETGIRGYALGGRQDLLDAYRDGLAREQRAIAELDRLFVDGLDEGLRRTVLDAANATTMWRSGVASPLLDHRDDVSIGVVTARSKPLLDVARAALDHLDDRIAVERRRALGTFSAAVWTLVGSIAVTIVVAFVGLAAAAHVLRRRVIRPVGDLNRRARIVADGDYDADLSVDGPLEIVELSESATAMRNRIRDDLVRSETARDELDRSNRDLEQFAYVASHDLQEPLRKVSSFCQLLDQRYSDELDERGRTYIHFAVDGAHRMQALISDLLSFSRVGRTTEQFVRVDLAEVVGDVVAGVDPDTGASFDLGALPVVDGDPVLLDALFANLVGNAVKYRSDAPPHVRVASRRSGEGWEISIRDNGIGIDADYREKVFVIFQRLHGRDEYKGTGIGLALCRKIAEFHGGTMRIDEPPADDGIEGGTLVTVWLPSHRSRPGVTGTADDRRPPAPMESIPGSTRPRTDPLPPRT